MVLTSKKEKPNYKKPLTINKIVFLYDARNENLKSQTTYEKECDIRNLNKYELALLKRMLNHLYGEY